MTAYVGAVNAVVGAHTCRPARQPYPEIMHALKVRRAIERIAATDGVDIVHDHTFAGPLNTPAYRAWDTPRW